jgi:hypothetical protein
VKKAILADAPISVTVAEILAGLKKCETGGCPVSFAQEVRPRPRPPRFIAKRMTPLPWPQKLNDQLVRVRNAAAVMKVVRPALERVHQKTQGDLAAIGGLLAHFGAAMDLDTVRVRTSVHRVLHFARRTS